MSTKGYLMQIEHATANHGLPFRLGALDVWDSEFDVFGEIATAKPRVLLKVFDTVVEDTVLCVDARLRGKDSLLVATITRDTIRDVAMWLTAMPVPRLFVLAAPRNKSLNILAAPLHAFF